MVRTDSEGSDDSFPPRLFTREEIERLEMLRDNPFSYWQWLLSQINQKRQEHARVLGLYRTAGMTPWYKAMDLPICDTDSDYELEPRVLTFSSPPRPQVFVSRSTVMEPYIQSIITSGDYDITYVSDDEEEPDYSSN